MRKIVLATAILALTACSESAPEPTEDATPDTDTVLTGDQPGFEAVAPGTYEVVHEDGSIDDLTIHPGMTWSMVFANGDPAGGTIFMQDGKTCFVTEGVEGHNCFTGTPPAEDGSIQSTADDGEVMTVRPVSLDGATAE